MLIHLIAWLLHRANARPPLTYRSEFYALKDRLLHRYGRRVGDDLQHIVKRCWNGPCWRCDDTGIYDQFWVRLERWQLGGRLFHRPLERQRLAVPGPATITGFIRHQDYGALSAECALWLGLLFDRGLFWRVLASSCQSGLTWLPLVTLQQLVSRVRRHLREWSPRRCDDCGRLFLPIGRRRHAYVCRRCAHVCAARHALEEIPF